MNRSEPLDVLLLAVVALAALAAIPAPPLPNTFTSPTTVIEWWQHNGPGAAIALIRLAMMLGFAYLGAIAGLFALGGLRGLTRIRQLALLACSPGLRRRLSTGALTLAIATTPATAHARPFDGDISIMRSAPGAEPVEPSTAFDLEPILLTDLGPVIVAPPTDVSREDTLPERRVTPTTPDSSERAAPVWVVQPGDNLWTIAEKTLALAGATTSVDVIAPYWRRMIALNAAILDANPNLIHAGQSIALPPITQP